MQPLPVPPPLPPFFLFSSSSSSQEPFGWVDELPSAHNLPSSQITAQSSIKRQMDMGGKQVNAAILHGTTPGSPSY